MTAKTRVGPLLLCLLATPAFAAAPASERDAAWDTLVADAQSHGGDKTVLDNSVSYVFQRPDGSYLALTHLLKKASRSVCLISKDQNATACVDWDSGKARYGERADAASPWRIREGPSLEEVASHRPSLLDQLWSMVVSSGAKNHKGYWSRRDGATTWTSPK